MHEATTSAEAGKLRLGLAAVTLVFLGLTVVQWSAYANWPVIDQYGGVDFELYRDAAARWFGGGPYFEPYQLAGPYEVRPGDVLYPPVALVLFVPFTFLPAVLWWAIPLGLTAWTLVRLRPALIVWPVMALCLWFPNTGIKLLTGNPVIWSLAALALGTLYAWPSVLVLLKPTLGPLALFGLNRRSWWVALGAFAAVSLLFLPMWPDYVRVILNARHPAGPLYSLGEVPMLLIPLAAWLGRRRSTRPIEGAGHRQEATAPSASPSGPATR